MNARKIIGGGGGGCDSHVDEGDFCAEGEGTQEAQMLKGVRV